MMALNKKHKIIIAFALLVVLTTALFLPAMAGWRGIFHDDQAMEEFSRYYFVAKNFQRGILPLWDPQTWCGAIPFYARYYADTYYPPQWPFYFFANLKNLDSVYWFLILLPLWLHYILAATGMFLLARRLLRCGYLSSGFAAMAYIYSPTFTSAYVWQQVIHVQAWLPWLIIAYVSTVERLRFWKVCAAGLITAFVLTGAAPTLCPFVIFIMGGIIITQTAISLRDNKRIVVALRPILIALSVIIIGACLSAVYLFSSLDGNRHTQEHIKLTTQDILNETVGSLPPVFLGTLFIPGMFGNITGKNMQQLNPDHDVLFWEANLTGGMFTSLLVVLGVFLTFRGTALDLWQGRKRRYVLLFMILYVFALLCVLGRHTPFYRCSVGFLPWIGQIPRPVRYRLIQCFSAAVLGAVGVEYLTSGLHLIKKNNFARTFWIFLGVSFLVGVLSFTYPWNTKEEISYGWSNIRPHSVDGYFSAGQSVCMYSPPGVTKKLGVYFNGESSGEIRYSDNLNNGLQEGVLVTNYYAPSNGWHEFDVDIPGHRYVWIYQKRGNAGIGYRKLAVPIDSLYYENKWSVYPFLNSIWFYNAERRKVSSPLIMKLKDNNLRGQVVFPIMYLVASVFLIVCCAYFLSVMKIGYLLFILAAAELFIVGLFSFYCGTYTFDREFPNHKRAQSPSTHPMLQRVAQNLFNITRDSDLRVASTQPFYDNFMRFNNNFSLMGYEMHPLDARFKLAIEKTYNRPFNYSIYYEDVLPQPGYAQFLGNFSVGFLMSTSPVGFFREGKVFPFMDKSGFFVHINPEALPRAFTINNVVAVSEEEQLRQLISGDLREAVFVGQSVYEKLQKLYAGLDLGKSFVFSDLQDKNRISRLNLDNPNCIEVDVDVDIPSMLVQTEVWHPGWRAMVDGLPADIYRVNYCQRGIWLERGRHRVRIEFRPEAWRVGAGISVLTAVLIMISFAVIYGGKGFLRNKAIRHR